MADIVDDLPKDTLIDHLIYYGLFIGAIFQMVCILAVIFIPSSSNEQIMDDEPNIKKHTSHANDGKSKQKHESLSIKKQTKQEKKKRK